VLRTIWLTTGFPKVIRFYKRKRLEALSRSITERKSATLREYRDGQAEIVQEGERCIRIGRAAKRLGISKTELCSRGDLQPVMRTIAGSETAFYRAAEIEEARRNEAAGRKALMERKPGQVNLREAAKVSGRSTWTLRDAEWCKENGITQERRKAGKRVAYWFVKRELIAYTKRSKVVLADARIHLVELATGEVQATLVGPAGYAGGACFSPDGRTLATGGHGTVLLWDLPSILGHASR
jgi:hypothetical protein